MTHIYGLDSHDIWWVGHAPHLVSHKDAAVDLWLANGHGDAGFYFYMRGIKIGPEAPDGVHLPTEAERFRLQHRRMDGGAKWYTYTGNVSTSCG